MLNCFFLIFKYTFFYCSDLKIKNKITDFWLFTEFFLFYGLIRVSFKGSVFIENII